MKNLVSALLLVLFFGCTNQAPKQVIDLSELSISDIHEAYKNGTYSSEELVSAYLDRIAAFDDQLNSISIVNPEALTIAKALDREYKETKTLRPLHGIPIIVKDNINTIGMPTTAGALALAEFMPDENAFIIQNLINAGAIILAKSNMAEWAFSPMHTESSTIGITRNPYNLDYVPAGSSGGTAASVAANFALLGLGTDTGNSIRGPSSHCSLVGFRTTLGLISRSGIVPLFLRNDVVGPMGRTVEDATRVMEVMAGFDPTDSITAHAEDQIAPDYIQFLKKDGLVGARIGVLRVLCDENTDPEILAVFEKALQDLDELGAKIIDSVVIADFDVLSENQWCGTFRKDVEAFLATYVKNDTIQSLEDVIRIGTHSEFAQRRLEAYSSIDGRWGKAQLACLDAYTDPARIAFREAIENMMDSLELDAIIYPTWTQKPAHIAYFEEEYGGDNSQSISPHTGQPAFTVPMGYVSESLPVGLQFLGRMFAEPTLIKLCYAYEQGTQHRKPPVIITSVKRI